MLGRGEDGRYVFSIKASSQDRTVKAVTRADLDTHADTCVGGANVVLLEHNPSSVVTVHSFSPEQTPLTDVPVGTCAGAYDCPRTGQTYLLIFYEMMYLGDRLPTTLLNPNQIRAAGHKVHDCPRQYDTSSSHSIITDDGLEMPLYMKGVISYLPLRKPTQEEIELAPRIEMTEDLPWDPTSHDFANKEERYRDATIGSLSYLPDTLCDDDTMIPIPTTRNISSIEIASDNNLYQRLRHANPTCLSHGDDTEERLFPDGDFSDFSVYAITSQKRLYCCERAAGCAIGTCCINCLIPKSLSKQVSATTSQRSTHIKPELLAARWKIGIEAARNTIQVSTQKGMRMAVHPVERRFRTAQPHIRKRRIPGPFYSDTAIFPIKSIRGDKYAQITTNGKGFSTFWTMRAKSDANNGLVNFINTVGIPERLVVDGAPEQGQVNTAWRKTLRQYHIHQTVTEPHSPWQNRAEGEIREIKRMIRRFTHETKSPKRLWCYLGEHVVKIRSRTASTIASERGRTPFENVMGWTPDISPYIQFRWYDWVYYLDPDGETKIGRWIGAADEIGGGDAMWILPLSCRPIVRSTVWAIPREDFDVAVKNNEREAFDRRVAELLGTNLEAVNGEIEFPPDMPDYGDLFDEPDAAIELDQEGLDRPEADDFTPDSFDSYLTAQVLLPREGELHRGTVKRRVKDEDGNPVGTRSSNPILDTRQYEVEFPDGATEVYQANMLAEHLYSQVDEEGRSYQLIDEIIDHRSDNSAVSIADGWFTTKSGTRRKKQTTKGWELLVQWRDGTSEWIPLRIVKEGYPIELAEYAVGNKLEQEPAFAWWIHDVLRKQDRMIGKVKKKYWSRTHKYGIRLPKTVEEALRFDKEDGTTYWRDAIDKEMKNVRIAFEFNDKDEIPIGHEYLRLHWVFDIKMMTLQRKARLVANGNEVDAPKESTFSSVVSRDSVRLFFTLAALNNLDVLSADIQNAYLNAETDAKLWIRADEAFGSDKGRPAKLVRALYGLPSSGARFRDHCAATLRSLGFESTKADPDVWLRPAKKADGIPYYQYVITYVDDIICAAEHPGEIMEALGRVYTLKDGSVKEPDLYLGANVKKWYIAGSDEPDKPRWALSSENYTKKAIAEVENELKAAGKRLVTKVTTPLAAGYRPELDATQELDADRLNYYQGLIGVLRWICELGRLDILTPVSMLSRYLVSAREGHLEQVFHTFAYLKAHPRSTLVFDDTEPVYDERRFAQVDWSEFYPGARESIPTDMPPPRGPPVKITVFVDADHAGCRVTRRSHTGVIIFVNRAPILWYSKRQNTVESSTFGSEFIAMKTAIEMSEGLRYKLRMFGVAIDGPANIFCDNDSVVKNSTRPESTLKKKHNAIAYHRVREALAAGTARIAKEDGETNLADILTKLLPGPRLKLLISRILW